MVWYFDSSALTKLVSAEAESAAVASAIENGGWVITTSALSITELTRAAARKGPVELAEARRLLAGLDVIPLEVPLLNMAAGLQPPALRSLDAIHIASALVLGPECEGIVTYDARMHEAARLNGFTIVAPGQSP